MEKRVLGLFAHPDDAELMCAGTLSLMRKLGWEVHIATMAPGDKGTVEYNRAEISAIRKAEAKKSAELIGGTYHCLEFEDVYILYDRETVNAASALIRKVKPSIVFTASPSDYMVDHEMTSMVAQTACFCCGIKNLEVEEPTFEPVPYLYYCDAMEGKDKLGQPLQPSMYVDISEDMPVKEKMLGCHESQRNWLLEHHKMDEYILAMKRFAAIRGKEIGTEYAEGFRQHLGHGYPQDNILQEILGKHIRVI
ncbi:PIG-L family deacetylase [Mariniphaga sediminis]|uniref:PIG-L family deacetylase n=1 Tax=Mariniphaga sediminis TaxID=1628158 RepID=A0A399D9I4_9BACT|nr:PIG-L family deacetylase [Mariniphaga sediminis]RIH66972.1 PIG-L family deacetylase [Mariniphaga sediminis]